MFQTAYACIYVRLRVDIPSQVGLRTLIPLMVIFFFIYGAMVFLHICLTVLQSEVQYCTSEMHFIYTYRALYILHV